jgi:integrase
MSLTQQWGAYMAFTGSAPGTVTTRTRALRRLERERGDLAALTHGDLVAYLSQYGHASTRATVLSYVRCFYAWALDEGHVAVDPTSRLPKVKVPKSAPRPAPLDEVSALLHAAPPRTRSFALLMAYAGLRCCEVAGFRPEHLVRDGDGGWWVDIPVSKGGHHQRVPIPHDVAEAVQAGPSWTVKTQTVQKDVRDALKSVGSTATPHQLRHYYATSALRSTQNLAKVQQMMRHASPATTARYTQVISSELTAAAEGLPRIA